MEDWATELVKDDIENRNIQKIGNVIGKIVSISPLKISIENGSILLGKEELYITKSLKESNIKNFILQNFTGTTNSVNDGGDNATDHSHELDSLEGEIKFTDTLSLGDNVLLIPTENEQKWFIIDIIEEVI